LKSGLAKRNTKNENCKYEGRRRADPAEGDMPQGTQKANGVVGGFLRGSSNVDRGVLRCATEMLGSDGEPHGRAGPTGLEVASKLEVATMWTMSNLEVLIFLAVMIAITGTVMRTLR
jgi:hypothetical protein